MGAARGATYQPPALVIATYQDVPRVFLFNEEENRRWLEPEDVSEGWVYDIMYRGKIEVAVSPEWLRPWDPHESYLTGSHD